MNNLNVTIHGIINGHFRLRDYVVREAISDDKEIIVKHGNEKMTLDRYDLTYGYSCVTKEKYSKLFKKHYREFMYMWIPDKK